MKIPILRKYIFEKLNPKGRFLGGIMGQTKVISVNVIDIQGLDADIKEEKPEPFMSGAVILSITGKKHLLQRETEQIIKSFIKNPGYFEKDYGFNKDILANVDLSYLIQATEKYVPWLKRYLEGLIERAKQEPGLETAGINAVLVLQGSGINMVEYAKESEELKDRLWRIVYRSREDENITEASGIAISILNGCRISFTGMDLRGIRIPRANMIGSICDSTDFSGADLRNVKFSNSWLARAKFNEADMKGIKLGWLDAFSLGPDLDPGKAPISVSLSQDGKRVVVGGNDGSVRVWDVENGECMQTLAGHSRLECVTHSPDGGTIASGSKDGTVRVWALGSGEFMQTLSGHTDWVTCLSISKDSKYLASGSRDYSVRVWSLESGECLRRFSENTGTVMSVNITGDGKRVVNGDFNGTVQVWDVENGKCLLTIPGYNQSAATSVSISGDGKRVVGKKGQVFVYVWDVESGECIQMLRELESFNTCHNSVNISSDGKQVVSNAGSDFDIRVWNVESGMCVNRFSESIGYLTSVSISLESQRVVGLCTDGTLRVCDLNRRSEDLHMQMLSGHSEAVTSVSIGPDGKRVVSGSRDGSIKVWDGKSGECLRTLTVHNQSEASYMYICNISMSEDGKRMVSGSKANSIQVWDVESGECLQKLIHSNRGSGMGNIIPYSNSILVNISGDGKRIVSSGTQIGNVRVWDVESGECLLNLPEYTDSINCVGLSATGKQVVVGSEPQSLQVRDVESGESIIKLAEYTSSINCVGLSATGKQVVVGRSDGSVRVWDLDSGECVQTLQTLDGRDSIRVITCISLSIPQKRIVIGKWDKSVQVWDIESGECMATLVGHTDHIDSVSISGDGKRVVSGSRDKTLRVWDISGLPEVRLDWIGTGFPLALYAEGAVLDNARGLSVWNRKLLAQAAGQMDINPVLGDEKE